MPQLHATLPVKMDDALIIQQTPQNVTVRSDGKDSIATNQTEVRYQLSLLTETKQHQIF